MNFARALAQLLRRIRGPRYRRLDLQLVTYDDAELLLKLLGWRIAKEEDTNRRIGWVYLEFVVEVP